MSERSEELRIALATRLERVRGNMTDAEFARLAADVVSTAQRFEEIEAHEREGMTPLPGTLPTFKEPTAST